MTPSGVRMIGWATLVVVLTFGTAIGSIFLFDTWVGQERESATEVRFSDVLGRIDENLSEAQRSNDLQEANQDSLEAGVDVIERVGLCFIGLLLVVPEERVTLSTAEIAETCGIPPGVLAAMREAFDASVG